METSRIIMWKWIIILLPISLGSPAQYEIQPLRKNSGLFYEKLEPLRLTQTYWRIVTYLDIGNFSRHFKFDNMLNDITYIHETCLQRSTEEDCQHAAQLDTLTTKLNRIRMEHDNLNRILSEIQYYAPKINIQPRTMHKRRVPMLGFIGSILGPVVGLLTSEDGEEYNNLIDELHDKQNNLSRILRQQTHIVNAEIQNIHQELLARTNVIHKMQKSLHEVIANMKTQAKYWNDLLYYRILRQWAAHVNLKFDHLLDILTQFIHIVINAREKKIHPALLSSKQFQEIITEIHAEAGNYEFPIPSTHIRMEELIQVGKADIGYHSKRLLISIDIPLLERTIYQLYRIHSYPVFQNLIGNITGAAYILPKNPFLALSSDDQKFFLADNEYYNSCKKTVYHTICETSQPVYLTATNSVCEILMLIKPSREIIQKCDVRINLGDETYWTQIPSLQAWLYSTNKPELLNVNCPNKRTDRGYITESGILRLGSGCIAKTKNAVLTGVTVWENKEEYIYSPNISLNLTNISSIIANFPRVSALHIQALESQPVENWKELHKGEPLTKIEEQLLELEQQQHYHRSKTQTIIGTSFGIFLLTLIAITYCGRNLITRMYRKCKINIPNQNINNNTGMELQPLSIDNTQTSNALPEHPQVSIPTTSIRIA